jgi:hypothetical protein
MRASTLLFLILSLLALPTIAAAQDTTSAAGPLVISEILYDSAGPDTDREYIEVYNPTDSTVDLENWFIVGEDTSVSNPTIDDVNSSVVVEPDTFAVLCENADSTENGGVDCAYDYANSISHTNVADRVALWRPDSSLVDSVAYDEDGAWPEAVDASIEYTGEPDQDNAQPQHWQVAPTRRGDFADTTGTDSTTADSVETDRGSPNVDARNGSLPVELTAFRVTATGQRAVLRWQTAAERDNARFVVQHRTPGATDWARRGTRDGAGTTHRPQRYTFTTQSLSPGIHTFRLRQVDRDGTVHRSAPRPVEIRSRHTLRLVGPNPLRRGEQMTITVDPGGAGPVRVALYDLLGRRLRTLVDGSVHGPVRTHLSAEGLPSGVYFLRATGPSTQQTRRITVVQ